MQREVEYPYDACRAELTSRNSIVGPIFRLAANIAPLNLLGRTAVYSPSSQCVFDLNASASEMIGCLRVGASFDALVDLRLESGGSRDEIEQQVLDMLQQWAGLGLISAAYPDGADPMFALQRISIAGHGFNLVYHDEQVQRQLAPTFRNLEDIRGDCAPTIHLAEVAGLVVVASAERTEIVPILRLAPTVRAMLVDHVLRHSGAIALHAACLVTAGRCVLLLGAPGAGKTTLALAATAVGFEIASDDVTLLLPDGRAQGLPFAAALKQGSWELLPKLASGPVHERGDGARLRYVVPSDALDIAPLPIAAIIKLDRTTTGGPGLSTYDPLEALRFFLKEGWSAAGSANVDDLKTFERMLHNAEIFELNYSTLGPAARLLADQFGAG